MVLAHIIGWLMTSIVAAYLGTSICIPYAMRQVAATAWPLECVATPIEGCVVWKLLVSNQSLSSNRPFVVLSCATTTVITSVGRDYQVFKKFQVKMTSRR